MTKKLNISIAKPCSENWDKMTACENGRFCGKCEKEVIDFTKMTTDQVIDSLMKKSGQNICGVLRRDQLEKPKSKTQLIALSVYQRASAHFNTSGARLIFLMALSSILILTGCGNLKKEVKISGEIQIPKEGNHHTIMGDIAPLQEVNPDKNNFIKGKIIQKVEKSELK